MTSLNQNIDWTKHSKLGKFFKGDTCTKRIKSLLAFEIGSTDKEQCEFYQKYFSDIYKCVLDSIQYYDYVYKKHELVNISEVVDVLKILLHLLHRVDMHIKRKWQARSIGNLITQLLKYSCDFELRAIGMNVAMLFIDILGTQADPNIKTLIADAMNFATFDPNDLHTGLKEYYSKSQLSELPNLSFAIAKSSTSMVDTLKLLDQLLTFIIEIPTSEKFPFWFELLKTSVFPLLYPKVCISLGIINNIPNNNQDIPGFKHDCPHEIQELIVRWLSRCLRNPELAKILCNNEQHLKLIDEISRQTLNFQPNYPSYRDSIHRVVEYYISWINNEASPYLTNNIQLWLQTIIDQVSSMFFDLDFDASSIKEKIIACQEVIKMYEQISLEPQWELDTKTWERFLVTLLNVTNFVVKTSELQKGGTTNSTLIETSLLNPLLNCLFDCFIRSATMTTLWEELQDKLNGWIHRLPVIRQWKIKIVTLSKNLITWLGVENERLREIENNNNNNNNNNDNNINVMNQLTSRFNTQFRLWDHFLRIAPHPNSIENIQSREIVLDGIVSSLGVFLDVIQNPRPKPTRKEKIQAAQSGKPLRAPDPSRSILPSANTIIKIFGPILFDVAGSPDPDFGTGRAVAFGALCRIFGTRSDEIFDEIYLSTFYQLIHIGLTWNLENNKNLNTPNINRMQSQLSLSAYMHSHDRGSAYIVDPDEKEIQDELNSTTTSADSIRWTILRNSSQLFQVDLNGVNILIPDYMRVISYALHPNAQSTTPKGIQRVCVDILLSWISLPYYYPGVSLPNLSKDPQIIARTQQLKDEEARLLKVRETRLRKLHDKKKGLEMSENPIFALNTNDVNNNNNNNNNDDDDENNQINLTIEDENNQIKSIDQDEENDIWGTFTKLWHEMRILLLQIADVDKMEDGHIVHKSIWALTIMVHLHLDAIESNNKYDNGVPLGHNFVNDCIQILLKCCDTYDTPQMLEARTAIEALKVLAYVQKNMSANVFTQVVGTLTKVARNCMTSVVRRPDNECVFNCGLVASEIIYCLMEWIMLSESPSDFLDSQSTTVTDFFEMLN